MTMESYISESDKNTSARKQYLYNLMTQVLLAGPRQRGGNGRMSDNITILGISEKAILWCLHLNISKLEGQMGSYSWKRKPDRSKPHPLQILQFFEKMKIKTGILKRSGGEGLGERKGERKKWEEMGEGVGRAPQSCLSCGRLGRSRGGEAEFQNNLWT